MSAETAAPRPKPWEGPEYDFVEAFGYDDPVTAASELMSIIKEAEVKQLLPDAEIIRGALRGLHSPPPDFDIEQSTHFVKALGIERPDEAIICSRYATPSEFHHLIEAFGIPWYNTPAQHSHQIRAVLMHLDEVPNTYTSEQALVHELAHSGLRLTSRIWGEGFACLTDRLFRYLQEPDEFIPRPIQPPYDVHDAGYLAMLAVCNRDPSFYDTVASYLRNSTVETLRSFLAQGHELFGGAQRFMYINNFYAGAQTYPTLSPAFDGIITQEVLDNPDVFLRNLLPLVEEKLKKYEDSTGYMFNFPYLQSKIGSVALRQTDALPDDPDIVTAAIHLVIETMLSKNDASP